MERDSSSSSDEDEDEEARRNLVPQNETKPPRGHSALEISGDIVRRTAAAVASGGFWSTKRYLLLAICLPLVLILLFFSLDLGRLFRGVSIIRVGGDDGGGDRMREAELRALYLLRDQQLGLLKLLNRTIPDAHSCLSPASAPSSMSSNSTSSKVDLPDSSLSISAMEFRSALLEQIKINKEIQKALLSSHRFGNITSEPLDDSAGADLPHSAVDVCRKIDRPTGRRTIEWKPKKDKFLFAICLSGQMSNHLICLEKHMLFAALLDRVLVLPSTKFDYQYDRVLDINHINECFGRKVVMPFEEFSEVKKNKMQIDRFICYMASPPCFLDEEHIKRLKNMGISLGKIEAAWPEDAKLKEPKKRVVGDIMPKFSSDAEVLAIGDMFYADVEEEWLTQPGGPLAHKCKTVIQPSKLIMLTAQRFVQTFLGGNFVALHFRRHLFPMTNLHETTLEAAFRDDELEETFASKPRCITFLCFGCRLENPRRSGYRSLVHEDTHDEKWWKQRSQRAKEQLSESVARLRWRKAAAVDGEHLKRRKVVFSYSFRSYALNFDEGKDLAAERDEISIQVLGVN